MSAPIATPADLGTYLELAPGTIDAIRATQSLLLAQDLCETIWSSLNATALGTVLAVAARQFNNVSSAHQLSLGTGHVSYGSQNTNMGIGGLYLSRSDKTTLRRLAGRGGAFSVSIMPTGTNAVWSLTVAAAAGTFTLSFAGTITTPIVFNATTAAIQTSLEALGNIGAGNVTVSGAGPFTVTFVGTLATTPIPPFVANGTNLTGTVVTVEVTLGVLAPGQATGA